MGKYLSCGKYFVRQAVLPAADAQNNPLLNTSKGLNTICHNTIFRQAVLCASESLYQSMNDYINGKIEDPKRIHQIELAISQYWMRMSSRATPFGLFSYVSIGNSDSKHEIKKDLSALIDADYEWILSLSKSIEVQHIEKLSFISNGLISDLDKTYSLPYVPGQQNSMPTIPKSQISSLLIDQCRGGQYSFQDLLTSIRSVIPKIDPTLFKSTVEELLINDFLISDLRPNLSSQHLITAFVNQLERIGIAENLSQKLRAILDLIEYSSSHIFERETEDCLLNIIKLMREINNTQHVLKTNLISKSNIDVLSKKDIKTLEDFANFFVSTLSYAQNRFTLYDEYKDLFLNKYGDFRLVQLTRMLDPQVGIGVPQTFKESRHKRKGIKAYSVDASKEFKYYALSKYREALQQHTEICVDDLLDKLATAPCTGIFPESFDLIFKISTDESGHKYFLCNKDFGCIGAGRTIGRFSPNWDIAINTIMQLNSNENNYDDILACDLLYLPQRLHLGNVATSPELHDYCLAFYQNSKKHMLSISDIYVGIKENRFFLYSKSLKQRLKVNTSNLLYYFGDSPEIRFLKEVQLDGFIRWDITIFDALMNLDYVPEIRYKSIILHPETWRIIPPQEFKGFSEFDKWFQENYSFLNDKPLAISYADNELKINLKNSNSRYLIYKHLIHNDSVSLVKTYNCQILKHTTEIVVPFSSIRKGSLSNDGQMNQLLGTTLELERDPYIAIGQNWLSFELYGCSNPERYVSHELSELMEQLVRNEIIDSFYYLYYADPFQHIRIRLYKKGILHNIEQIIYSLNKQVQYHHIETFKLCPYNREIERYGGNVGMTSAEKMFCADSKCAIHLIKHFCPKEREIYYVISALSYMKIWGWDFRKQLDWLEKNICRINNDKWRDIRNSYYNCYQENRIFLPAKLSWEKRNAISNYSNQNIKQPEMQERILAAILHMSFNRLFGMNQNKEKELTLYIRNLLREIIARERKL